MYILAQDMPKSKMICGNMFTELKFNKKIFLTIAGIIQNLHRTFSRFLRVLDTFCSISLIYGTR